MKNLLTLSLVSCSILLFSFIGKISSNAGMQTYKVDAKKSTMVWVGKKITGSHTGIIPISSGTIMVENKMIKSGTFDFNVAGITNTDIKDAGDNAKLIGHLKSDDFFSTAKHPKATFVITSATSKGGDMYDIKGKLTIKGITNDLSFPATVKMDGKNLTAKGEIKVDRTKYDIKFKSASFFENLGDNAISDDFVLDVNLVATM